MAVSLFNSGTFPAVAAGLGQKRAFRTNWLTVQPGSELDLGGWRDPKGLSHSLFTFPSFQNLMLRQQYGLPDRDGFATGGEIRFLVKRRERETWIRAKHTGLSS